MVSSDEINLHAKRKRVIVKLVEGRKFATQLQTLLRNPIEEHGNNSVSVEELALQICRSFSESLDVIQSFAAGSAEQHVAGGVDCGGDRSSGDTGKLKDQRGCYKRRKTSDSWTTVSNTTEDCHGWRKYGQKKIRNSKYHRCYYRCTHKHEGCKALKQVQKIKENPLMYKITYFHYHTCKKNITVPQLAMDSEPAADTSILISFQSDNNYRSKIPTTVKQESKQLHSNDDLPLVPGDIYIPSDDEKSMADIPWKDIVGSELALGSYSTMASGFDEYSSGSTSLNGFDMEADQLGNIESFHYFDNM